MTSIDTLNNPFFNTIHCELCNQKYKKSYYKNYHIQTKKHLKKEEERKNSLISIFQEKGIVDLIFDYKDQIDNVLNEIIEKSTSITKYIENKEDKVIIKNVIKVLCDSYNDYNPVIMTTERRVVIINETTTDFLHGDKNPKYEPIIDLDHPLFSTGEIERD